MLFWLAGILVALATPFQTGMNLRLRHKFGSPFVATLISFVISLGILCVALGVTGESFHYPWGELFAKPLWIWLGGIIGVVFLTGNILLLPRIGGVQTVIFPVFGQITMGLVVDHFGLFHAPETPATWLRILGALFVVAGLMIVSLAKQTHAVAVNTPKAAGHWTLWIWRLFAVFQGTLGAIQIAVNGYLGHELASPVKSALMSFLTGSALLIVICLVLALMGKLHRPSPRSAERDPWWIWLGGLVGAIFIYVTVILSQTIGTGTTMICILMGATVGGMIVDYWGLFGTRRQALNAKKVAGLLLMVAGAAMTKLLV